MSQPALAAAMRCHQDGRLQEAERQYRALLQRQPRNSDAQNLLGLVRLQQQDNPGAIAALKRAVMLRPEAEYLRNLGVPFKILEQDTYSVVKRVIPEGRTMCSLCSRLRRGALSVSGDSQGRRRR